LGSNERDMRYSKWSDFIRTDQKKAIVELHIQKNSELIKIRRTVIRGQSPFFQIQKTSDDNFRKVNAIEIQELIKELKINPDNQFAFVSQGKIDVIKSLKPIELCRFLEEGIGLIRLRNEIIQQKDRVHNLNLELKSLISKKNGLNIHLDLLKPKLERLEEKKKIEKVKKKFTDELLWANRKKIQEEIIALEEKLMEIEKSIVKIKKEKEKNNNKIKTINQRILEIDEKIIELSKEFGEQKFQKQELNKKILSWQQEKLNMKQILEHLEEKISKIEKIVENIQSQKESLDNEITLVKEKKSKIDNQIDVLIKEQNDLGEKITRNKKFLEEYNRLITEKSEKRREIKENKNLIVQKNKEIEGLFERLSDIDHKFENNKWFLDNPSPDILNQINSELKKVSSRLLELSNESDKLENEKKKILRKLSFVKESLRKRKLILPSNIIVLKEEIERREYKVKGPIIEDIKYDDQLSLAIESVLGEKLLYSFIANDWNTLDILKRLKQKFNAYCNIYIPKKNRITPLPRITGKGIVGYLAELIEIEDNEIKKVIYSKIKNCLVVETYRDAKEIYKKSGFGGKCVTLKGEQIISYKYAYETPHTKKLKGLLSTGSQKQQSTILENENKSINRRLAELKVEFSKLDAKERDLFRKKSSFHDLNYYFKQRQKLTDKKNQLYKERSQTEKLISGIKNQVDELELKIKSLEKEKDPEFFKWNERIKEIPKELSELSNDKKDWELRLSENEKEMNNILEKLTKVKQKKYSINLEYKTKKENFQKADKDAFEVYRKLSNIEDTILKIKNNISAEKQKRLELEDEKRKYEEVNIQIALKFNREETALNKTKNDIRTKTSDLERINAEIGPLIADKKIEIKSIEEIKAEILKIDKQLLNYLDVDDRLLIEKEQIITSLKEIAKNQSDLEKDIKAAVKTENKMEFTYYNKFKKSLKDVENKINEKFKVAEIKIYSSLYLHGEFEELGVEIKAATSKDQLRKVSALSGGQVSMISICLMLSLLEIRPQPLSMYDEAAMFLDDKNSEIAYKLIKTTLEENPVQMILFLPKSSKQLYLLADKLIGIARAGKEHVSTVFKPKILKKKNKS